MQEYFAQGNIRPAEVRYDEAMVLAFKGKKQHDTPPAQLPDSVETLCRIKHVESMSSAAEVRKQWDKQYVALETDFRVIVQCASSVGKYEA